MHELLTSPGLLADVPTWLVNTASVLKVLLGFSLIIFVHELGHFLAAKWCGIRVDRFAVGFGYRLFGWRRGEGFTFGNRPDYNPAELAENNYGETDYCFKALPIGGYVRMLGQDDIIIDEKTGEMRLTDDPRAFPSRPVGQRMLVVSAGVVFNLLFAAVLFTGIFLVGKQEVAAVVFVPVDSELHGQLLTGDRVVALNGHPVRSYRDLDIAWVFADGPIHLTVERDGRRLEQDVIVNPGYMPGTKLREMAALPFPTPIAATAWPAVRLPRSQAPPEVLIEPADGDHVRLPAIRRGDEITHIDGVPVATSIEVLEAFQRASGRLLRLTVRRESAEGQTADVYHRAALLVARRSPAPGEPRPKEFSEGGLLGMLRRARAEHVVDGGPASRGGLQPGDVIAEWGTIANPTFAEVMEVIRASANRPIRVFVERGGQRVGPLEITPRREFRLFSQGDPKVQVRFAYGECDRPIVAAVEPDSPAAAMGLPRGAELLEIDGRPVRDWYDVVDVLMAAAGRTVDVRYRSGGDEGSGRLAVPGNLVAELGLPRTGVILSVDGKKELELAAAEGEERRAYSARSAADLPWILREYVGRTVSIEYRESMQGPTLKRDVQISEANADAWPMLTVLIPPSIAFEPTTVPVTAEGNPLAALKMGFDEAIYWVKRIYFLLNRMFVQRSVGVEQVSGPVGIFSSAMEQARIGWVDLMYFMALISVNLAVLNFLPIPVMDGGMMVFLLIEKIKGKPLSLKTQMITTLVGLAALLVLAVVVTLQDIGRLFS